MALHLERNGQGQYMQVGTQAGAETKTGPQGAPDPATIQPLPCPLDGSPCYVVGSQSNPWRCQAQGHQWALVAGSNPVLRNLYYLVASPYVFVSILAPVVPFSVPVTLG